VNVAPSQALNPRSSGYSGHFRVIATSTASTPVLTLVNHLVLVSLLVSILVVLFAY
jgi:hypothetical protein